MYRIDGVRRYGCAGVLDGEEGITALLDETRATLQIARGMRAARP